jgi:hypothetical protein
LPPVSEDTPRVEAASSDKETDSGEGDSKDRAESVGEKKAEKGEEPVFKSDSANVAWRIANSSLAIFLLGAIFVTGLGASLTKCSQMLKDEAFEKATARRLLQELDLRTDQIGNYVALIRLHDSEEDKGRTLMYAWRVARGTTDYQPALPEFRGVHMAGLIIQLDALGYSEDASDAIAAAEDLDIGVEFKDGKERQSPRENFRVFGPEHLDRDLQALQRYRDSVFRKAYPDRLFRKLIALEPLIVDDKDPKSPKGP